MRPGGRIVVALLRLTTEIRGLPCSGSVVIALHPFDYADLFAEVSTHLERGDGSSPPRFKGVEVIKRSDAVRL